MVRLEDAVTARYNFAGHKFEVLVDSQLAMDYIKGKEIDIGDLFVENIIFKDASKGEQQKETELMEAFKTTEFEKIYPIILTKGQIQLTTVQRKEMKEKREKEVLQLIVRNAINPQTNAPHPEERLKIAMEELGINIDPLRPANIQFKEISDKLKTVLPMSFDKAKIAVKIPAIHSGKVQGIVRQYKMVKEEWQSDGSFVAVLEMPAGLKSGAISKLSSATNGEIEIKDIKE